jgi:ferredoxin-NADP reductase
MTSRTLHLTRITDETPTVRHFELSAADHAPLPGFSAGAHVTIEIPEIGQRKYSLINTSTAPSATSAPQRYTLGIRIDPEGGGGSRFMHALKIGDQLNVSGPDNQFPLKANTLPPLLVGGGIGITPLISMAAELKSQGQAFRIIYAVRNRTELAFKDALAEIAGDGLHLHVDDEAKRVLDLASVLGALPVGTHAYMCGPKPMLKAGIAASRGLGWPVGHLMFELFYSAAPVRTAPVAATDGSFEVELKSRGQVFKVPLGKSILDVLVDAGLDPMHDCKKGECGVCQVGVLAGVPDHRDVILSESERASNKVMQICISRSKSPRLVLDL